MYANCVYPTGKCKYFLRNENARCPLVNNCFIDVCLYIIYTVYMYRPVYVTTKTNIISIGFVILFSFLFFHFLDRYVFLYYLLYPFCIIHSFILGCHRSCFIFSILHTSKTYSILICVLCFSDSATKNRQKSSRHLFKCIIIIITYLSFPFCPSFFALFNLIV